MRNKISIAALTVLMILAVTGIKSFAQDSPMLCDSYESLLKAVKDGITASYYKTAYIKKYSMAEKSLVTIRPITGEKQGYDVTFTILDLYPESLSSSDEGSVLGFMMENTKGFGKNSGKFINTSCMLTTESPEGAVEIAKGGITFSVDMIYYISGNLVDVYNKYFKNSSPNNTVVKKPAVYLYPEKNMNVSVKVIVNGHLTVTEPDYGTGWNVNASPDGIIDGKYDYLFYEAALNRIDLPDEGWVVEYNKIEKWFDETLPAMGLNKKETEQFKEYWLKDLKKANYYEIKLLGNEFLENNMRLDITPAPETLVRLNFHFKPVYVKTELKAPEIKKIERKGFTVIEWGGINSNEQLTINN